MKTNKHYWQTGFCVVLMLVALSSCKKESSSPFNFDYVPVQMSKDGSWSILDKDGNEVVKEEYPVEAEISLIKDGVYWVKTNGKCQLFSVDSPKKPLTEEEFTNVTLFNAGVAAVSNPNEMIRIINTKGMTVTTLPNTIKKCWAFSGDGYAVFQHTSNKVGILDSKGNIVVHADYSDMIIDMKEGLTLAKKEADDKQWIIIDMQGNKLGDVNIEQYFILNPSFYDGKIIVRDEGKEEGHSIILDKTGKKLFEIRKAREKYHSSPYIDGYLTYGNGDNKYGVVNDEGEEIIRPKYDAIVNLGNGEFVAKKGDKWGIINEKDETILDFDYEEGCLKMGDNYFIRDASGWVLVGKDKKDITSCYRFYDGAVSRYVEYVDVDGLGSAILKVIGEWEQPMTVSAFAKMKSLAIDDYHYSRSISQKTNIDDKITCTLGINYDDYITEEKTHVEQVNDGWFTYNKTVSDGWGWTNALPRNISGTFSLSENAGIDIKLLYNYLRDHLAKDRKKISDDTFSKNVKMGGKNVECRINCGIVGDNISLNISFYQ